MKWEQRYKSCTRPGASKGRRMRTDNTICNKVVCEKHIIVDNECLIMKRIFKT
jgi:hypothetical protein